MHLVLNLFFQRKHAAPRRQPLAVLQRAVALEGRQSTRTGRQQATQLAALQHHNHHKDAVSCRWSEARLQNRHTHHAQVADTCDRRLPAQPEVQGPHEGGVVWRCAWVARDDEQLHTRRACDRGGIEAPSAGSSTKAPSAGS